MFFCLPPAGEPIPPPDGGSKQSDYGSEFQPYAASFYGSGTEALAAALIAAVKLKRGRRPEVLVPAYTCPAVVSAVLYAGARPILIDNTPGTPRMNLEEVAEKTSDRTAAIVAVDLFGISERLPRLHELATQSGALLIEDSAQRMPETRNPLSQADMVVLSFGRGKPVSLLGGGAVLTLNPHCLEQLPSPMPRKVPSALERMANDIQVALYNFFLPPQKYWMVAKIPLLNLGETRYVKLKGLRPMPEDKLARLGPALRQYQQPRNDIHGHIRQMTAQLKDSRVLDLAIACDVADLSQLSRYPLLLETPKLRDAVLHDLTDAGLGASGMYLDSLPRIRGLENILAQQGPFPEADNFSKRVLTLPVHSKTKDYHVRKMQETFTRALHARK